MLVNKANLTAVSISLKTIFNKAFDGAPSDWTDTAMKVPSGSSQNDYSWLSRFPKMRKWLGDKVIKALSAFKYTVVNDDFEATVEVDRNDIEDDQIGLYGPQAQEAGYSSRQLPDELITELKDGAFANVCYDGQYFYDTDHPVKNANGIVSSVSNKGTAALSAATLILAQASLGAAIKAIMNFTDDEGRKLGLVPDMLEVGTDNMEAGEILCNNPKLQDDTPNPYYKKLTLKINPRLSNSAQWMVHVTNRPLKPFIYQERKAPVFVSQTSMEADDVFMRKKYKFGAEARAAGGYGLWQLSYGSTGGA